jgi:hypothetical protein
MIRNTSSPMQLRAVSTSRRRHDDDDDAVLTKLHNKELLCKPIRRAAHILTA